MFINMPVTCNGLSNKQKAKIRRKAGEAATTGVKEKKDLEEIEKKIAMDKYLLKTKSTNHSKAIRNYTADLRNGKCTKCKKKKNCSIKCSTLYKNKKKAIETQKIVVTSIRKRIVDREKEKQVLEKKQKEYNKARAMRKCLNNRLKF